MSAPTTTNSTANAVNTIIVQANSTAVAIIAALIIADQPWLGNIVTRTILMWLLNWLDGPITKAMESGATFAIVDIDVVDEKNTLSDALAAVIAARQSGDPNALKLAIQAYANANSALIHDDGGATPQ